MNRQLDTAPEDFSRTMAVATHLDDLEAGAEQVASAAGFGVHDITFLGHPDRVVENRPALRRDIGRQIRRFRPDMTDRGTWRVAA